jgi:hypothetical protein
VKRPSADDTEGTTLCGKYATARRLIYIGHRKALWDCFAHARDGKLAGKGGDQGHSGRT